MDTTAIDPSTIVAGKTRFRYTGNPEADFLGDWFPEPASSVTGTFLSRNYGDRWWVRFDEHPGFEPGRRSSHWVSLGQVTIIGEPEPFKVGDRFTYTGDPARDWLPETTTGATGTLVRADGAGRWYVDFDRGPHYHGEEDSRCGDLFVSESRITKLAAETAPPSDLAAERDKAVAELAALKETVVRVAREAARQHDWCGVVDEALEDMGLLIARKTKVRATVVMSLDVEHYGIEPEASDVENAFAALDVESTAAYVDSWRVA